MSMQKGILPFNCLRNLLSAYIFLMWINDSTAKTQPSSIDSNNMRPDSVGSTVMNHRQLETFNLWNSTDSRTYDNTTNRYRSRRNANSGGWNKLDITWSFNERSLQSANLKSSDASDVIRSLIAAFNVWSSGTCLNFYRVNYNDEVDIRISFERGDHGDAKTFFVNYPLAHAHHPGEKIGGDIHFNADINWKLKPCDDVKGSYLQYVAVHEIGHALGLGHSKNRNGIMYEQYYESDKFEQLSEDDIRMIEQIYGRCNRRSPMPKRLPATPCNTKVTKPPKNEKNNAPPLHQPKTLPPNICKTSFNAVTMFRGELWLFKNQYYWWIDEQHRVVGPDQINQRFDGLPVSDTVHINAAFETISSGIIFFIGKSCYHYDSTNLGRLSSKCALSDLGLPTNLEKIDAALRIDSPKRAIYFFSGMAVWEFDENMHRVKSNYPENMNTRWQGISRINGAFQDNNRMIYFLKENMFTEFDGDVGRITKKNPTSIRQWAVECPYDPTINSNGPYIDEGQRNAKRNRTRDEGITRKGNKTNVTVQMLPENSTENTKDNRPKNKPNDDSHSQDEQQNHEEQQQKDDETNSNNSSLTTRANNKIVLLHLITFMLWNLFLLSHNI